MFTKSKDYLNLYFENEKDEQRKSSVLESQQQKLYNNQMEETQNIYEMQLQSKANKTKALKIRAEVKKSLLSECIYKIYRNSITLIGDKYINESIMRTFVNDFIQENGVENLLLDFGGKSYMLSEFARIINEYTDIICEKCNSEQPDNFTIDPEDKQNFYDDLNMDDVEAASEMIKTRVSSAIDNFLSDNVNAKAEIKEIIQQSQDKIKDTNNEELKEFYEIQAKSKITNVREKKPKSIFETMVFNLAKATILNEDLKKIYLNNNKLNMDKIVESSTLMYTFLETVNTCKIKNIDEKYIELVIDDIK